MVGGGRAECVGGLGYRDQRVLAHDCVHVRTCTCVRAHTCARAFVRACVRARVRARARSCVRARSLVLALHLNACLLWRIKVPRAFVCVFVCVCARARVRARVCARAFCEDVW